VRLFADLGPPAAALLQPAPLRQEFPHYLPRLLAAFQPAPAGMQEEEQALPPALTPREQEILGQIARGLSNREIAGQAVISAETVKRHARSIYVKLGVHNRTQAVTRARELGLLK
jgi:LuxR family transcriptional regulator, maltose regulon positive regulatory protein